ncbi:FAD binding domain-containing protein [Marinibaculum pumilum]|uniref:FAD binding domain-containing protein n=1 Tax=Marinibaculum pumilum TaxID=1766165 RepID=A0ABV7L1M6_9PROT
MTPFAYSRATGVDDALAKSAGGGARFLGGGTNLVDLLRQNIEACDALVDVSRLPAAIEARADGGLLIGGAARNSAVAAHPAVRTHYPMLSRALLSGASAQIRNMATVAGNILQRPRCVYFYDPEGSRCNRRAPGSGCDAIGGLDRHHAILGASPHCVAVHPSDMCVALAALDAVVHLAGAGGARQMPLTDFLRLPGDRPEQESELQPGELITAVEIPASAAAAQSVYRKVRDRSSYAFALVSVAAGLHLADGRIAEVRIALGGVAPVPWRARRAEAVLQGQAPSREAFAAAAEAELAAAQPLAGNGYKTGLAQRVMAAVLGRLAGLPEPAGDAA